MYRDLIIDYYSTYVTQDVVDGATLQKEKETWVDVLVEALETAKDSYEVTKNLNQIISYVNGIAKIEEMDEAFLSRITNELIHMNEVSQEATELRFDVAGLPYIKKYWNKDSVKKIVNGSAKVMDMLSMGFVIAETVDDVSDTVKALSKVEANKEVFGENMEVIEWFGSITWDKNIRAATDDVMELLAENYAKVYATAIVTDLIEGGLNVGINVLASKCAYVAIVVAVRDTMQFLLGTKEDLRQMYRVLCYSDMCNIYSMIVPMQVEESTNGRYYYCREYRVHLFEKYIRNLAQLRILGEKEYCEYLKGDGWLTSKLDSFFGTEGIDTNMTNKIDMVKRNTEILGIQLSKALNIH